MTCLELRFNGPIPKHLKSSTYPHTVRSNKHAEQIYQARKWKKFAVKMKLCLSFTNTKHTQH